MEAPTTEIWNKLAEQAFESLPEPHRSAVRNVAIVLEDEPSSEQRSKLELRNDQTLMGLYTGVPLPQRHGKTDLPPDVITLYKVPLLMGCETEEGLYENIRHTLWHELAHYFGLDHSQIERLE